MINILATIFFPFLVNKKLCWVIITGIGLSLLIKIGVDYHFTKLHTQMAGTFLEGLEPYRLLKRYNYLIICILIWTVVTSIKEYCKTFNKYY